MSNLFLHVGITPRPEQMQGTHLKQRIAHRMGKIPTALHVKRSLLRHHEERVRDDYGASYLS
jgi:hypothetical protein